MLIPFSFVYDPRKPRSGQIPIDIPSVPSTVVEFKLTHYQRTYRGRRQSHVLQTDPHKRRNNGYRQERLRAFHASSLGHRRAQSRVTNG
jgi:hypothetical protein